MAALSIFIVVTTALLDIFINTLVVERRVVSTQAALDNARYTLEIMARAIRQADPNTLDTESDCSAAPGTCLRFLHPVSAKGVVVYTYDPVASAILENSASTGNVALPITGSSVAIKRVSFIVKGQGTDDAQQPRVTIVARVASSMNPGLAADIQTTISLRTLQE